MEKKINRSVKLSDEFYEYAKTNSELNHRSMAAQIEYWANLGIGIEKKLSYEEIITLLQESKKSGYKIK